ncbi:MAG: hypothetical protein WBV94_10535 [Blastocatellia bacterium]
MAGRERNRRRYRIVLSNGETETVVTGDVYRSHLAAHRIAPYKYDDRKAATTQGWVSYIDHNTGELIFTARKAKVGTALPTNSKHLLGQLIFRPPYNEWLIEQEYEIYRRADA